MNLFWRDAQLIRNTQRHGAAVACHHNNLGDARGAQRRNPLLCRGAGLIGHRDRPQNLRLAAQIDHGLRAGLQIGQKHMVQRRPHAFNHARIAGPKRALIVAPCDAF